MPSKNKKVTRPRAKVSFRHNILPPLMGILAFVGVLGILNSQWVVAQAQYKFGTEPLDVATTIDTTSPHPELGPRITIPKIHVDAPVVVDEQSYNEAKVQLALRRGVLHYGNTPFPGQNGNMVLIGHSSGQLWAPGSYKFVFTMLDKMKKDDKIIIDYKGTRYIYNVTDTKIIDPSDLRVLEQTEDPTLTLITCTPVGTSKYRFIVHAKQISPKPDTSQSQKPSVSVPKELPSSAGQSVNKTIQNLFN